MALARGKSSTSWRRIREAGCFCVNVLSETQENVCLAFATSRADKFAGIPWTPRACGVPRLPGPPPPSNASCRERTTRATTNW
ncbi:flavin reductase family protein [Streptomyces sp. NPDC048511]|uniref:flavin reductase family protein n=1 Tax=Streptomyces sp. NPDC048511 TaxID=3365562 RepID=UPI0037229143